jgi:hypothetical protein
MEFEIEKINPHYFNFLEWVRKNCSIIDFHEDKWWQFTDKHGWPITCGIEEVYKYWLKNIN